jgi:hypothetical protein
LLAICCRFQVLVPLSASGYHNPDSIRVGWLNPELICPSLDAFDGSRLRQFPRGTVRVFAADVLNAFVRVLPVSLVNAGDLQFLSSDGGPLFQYI